MSINIATVQATKTIISVDGNDNSRERVRITFDDGDVLYFAVEVDQFKRTRLILDTETTDEALVDDILLPRPRGFETMCELEVCHDCDHQLAPETFDVFSVITKEQYKQLRTVYVELGEWRHDRVPEVGEELSVWYGWRMEGGGSGTTLKHGHVIAAIDVVSLDF